MKQERKLKAVTGVAEEDCRCRNALGPKALAWLRANMPPFAKAEADSIKAADERRANLVANGRLH